MSDGPPRCPGCGAAAGERHDRVCDVARCRATGVQFHACDHRVPAPVPHGPDTWSGRWPGEEDCERLGWYARPEPGRGWIPCAPGDPGAQPDIGRLPGGATWDPIDVRWVARTVCRR